MAAPVWKCFIEGIKALREHGWQKRDGKEIADDLGYTPTHISQVFQGKRKPGGKLQEGLAQEYGLHAEDVIRIGRNILEGEGFFPFIGQIEQFPAHSPEQARQIVSLTNRAFGIEGRFLNYRPECWDDFVGRRISATQFFERYSSELIDVIEMLKRREKRAGAKFWA